MDLGVRLLEGHVGQALFGAEAAGPFQHGRGEIDADRASGDGGASGLACGQPRAAADVEHTVVSAHAGSDPEVFVVQAQFSVVVEQAGLVGLVGLVGHRGHRILSLSASVAMTTSLWWRRRRSVTMREVGWWVRVVCRIEGAVCATTPDPGAPKAAPTRNPG